MWNLLILASHSRDPTGSNVSKVTLYNTTKTFMLVYSLPPFTNANLPRTNWFLHSVLAPAIKNITDKIYRYFPHHRWELPGNYPVFTVLMVIYRYVEKIGEFLLPQIFLYNIYIYWMVHLDNIFWWSYMLYKKIWGNKNSPIFST